MKVPIIPTTHHEDALASRERRRLVKAALLVIDAKGDGAMEYAKLRAVVLRQDGDKTRAEVWLRVLHFIAELKWRHGSRPAAHDRCQTGGVGPEFVRHDGRELIRPEL
jgi:hypothetical protein